MTVRLLVKYGFYPANSIYSGNATDEARLLRIGQASADLTGGAVYSAPATPKYAVPVSLRMDASGDTLVGGAHDIGVAGSASANTSALAGTRALRKSIDAAKTGVAAGPMFVVGDSTDRGPSGVQTQSWPYQLAKLLTASGIPASNDSVFGASNQATIGAFVAADARVTAGAGWVLNGVKTAGGNCFEFPANTAATALAFNPGVAFNQADIYYYQNNGAGFGQMAITRDATAATTGSPVNMGNVGQLIVKATITWSGAAATGTLNMQAISGATGKLRVIGFAVRDTANPKLEIINGGWAASSSADWIAGSNNVQTGPWSPTAAVVAAAPSCIVWGHGVNDFNSGGTSGGNTSPIDIGTFTTNMTTYYNLVPSASFVIVRKAQSDWTDPTLASAATQNAYFAAMQSFGAARSVPVIDMQSVCGDYPTAYADGLMLDPRHYNVTGYQRGARLVQRFISAL